MHKKWIILVGWSIFLTGVVCYGCEATQIGKIEEKEAAPVLTSGEAYGEAGGNGDDRVEAVELCVFVCGQVQKPGVYRLGSGARIVDAIDAAGGFTEAAAGEYWNLAEPVSDGEKIYVPDLTEAAAMPDGGDSSPAGAWSADGRLNINRATKEELMSLPGIGEKRAGDIVAYRKANGNFTCTEDIKKVSGIKDSIYREIKDVITVE